jgi:glycosyltransferase involved in cell wall biosynthesis
MRVLFVSPSGALGGAEHSLLLLAAGLRKRGVEVTVVQFADGVLDARLRALGVSTAQMRPVWLIRRTSRYERLALWSALAAAVAAVPTVLRIARLVRRTRADVIHTNGTKAHIIGGLAGRLAGVPVVWHLHDFPPSGRSGRIFTVAARWLPAAILAASEAVAARLVAGAGTAKTVHVVYNPIDLDVFHPALGRQRLRRALGIADDVPVVGLVAHLTPWKGHDVFLAVASGLADSARRPRFVIAGGPIYESDGHAGYANLLHERAVELGLSDRVTFLGARDDIPDVMAGIDVLMHTPTAPEPFGRVLAEAMAVGRPVVAARCGGIPEVVEDRVTGLLVPPGDVAGFQSAVTRLLDDPQLRSELGNAGRQHAVARFGCDAHVDKIVGVYRDIIARRHTTS